MPAWCWCAGGASRPEGGGLCSGHGGRAAGAMGGSAAAGSALCTQLQCRLRLGPSGGFVIRLFGPEAAFFRAPARNGLKPQAQPDAKKHKKQCFSSYVIDQEYVIFKVP